MNDLLNGLMMCKGSESCKENCTYMKNKHIGDNYCIERLHQDAISVINWLRKKLGDEVDTPQKAPETPQPWTREKILEEAEKNVCGQREQDYGTPKDSFLTVANLWTAYHGVEFTPIDVAAMLGLLKIARISSNPKHMDSWIDLAGYAACGGEIAGKGA